MRSTSEPHDEEEPAGKGFLEAAVIPGQDGVRSRVTLDARHQGWMEIPHGGILMSMILELAHRGLTPPLFQDPSPGPLRIAFRLGGPSLSIRDRLEVGARRRDGTVHGWVKKEQEDTPSLQAEFRCLAPSGGQDGPDMTRILAALQRIGNDPGKGSVPLPYSRSCFVCGAERLRPGLERRFFYLEGAQSRIVFTYVGLDPQDRERFHRFRLHDGQPHPGTLISVLDETLGWSGFVETRQGGVTVRLEVDVHRPADPGEKMLCIGVCTGTRGRTPERQFWFAEGAVLPMGEGAWSPIMTARGQWLSVPKLTEEMKRHLMPRDWLRRWFGPDKA